MIFSENDMLNKLQSYPLWISQKYEKKTAEGWHLANGSLEPNDA